MIEERVRDLDYRTTEYAHPNRTPGRIAMGALSGLIASAPMALWMLVGKRFLPPAEQYSVPPKLITQKVAEQTGIKKELDGEPGIEAASWLAHFGYGAAASAVYPLVFDRLPLPMLVKGALFAMAVWAGGYLGWLPALGILPSASREPAGRNWLMISSHLLWGSIIAFLVQKWEG